MEVIKTTDFLKEEVSYNAFYDFILHNNFDNIKIYKKIVITNIYSNTTQYQLIGKIINIIKSDEPDKDSVCKICSEIEKLIYNNVNKGFGSMLSHIFQIELYKETYAMNIFTIKIG